MSTDTEFWICATCGVEHARRPEVCAICADERQWVPVDGQRWTTLDELAAAGTRLEIDELEPDLYDVLADADRRRGPHSFGRMPVP